MNFVDMNAIFTSLFVTGSLYLTRLFTLPRRFDEFKEQTEKRFDAIDARFDKMDSRFDKMDERFERMERKMDDNFREIHAALRQICLYTNPPQWPLNKRIGED